MAIGSKVYRTQTSNDSMAWAKEHMLTASDGSVFLADTLTQARGRHGRSWHLAPGQLCVTFILKPPLLATLSAEDLPIRLNQLNMAISLGILEPLKSFDAKLKWPNDFIIDGKKVGGMLIQLVWHAGRPLGIVVGFSININNMFDADHPLHEIATSLKAHAGETVQIRPLYKNMLVTLNNWYEHWQQQKFMLIYKTWKENQAYLGNRLKIHQKDGSLVEGIAQQVMPNGDLLLVDELKKQQVISFYQVEEVK